MHSILEYHQKLYEQGQPLLSDMEYDRLEGYIKELKGIGMATGNTLQHAYQMYSLKKYYEGDNFPDWVKDNRNVATTPKLDGAAISCYYSIGQLTHVLKRGDGIMGEDCTKHIVCHNLVPQYIQDLNIKCVMGEVVLPKTHENARNKAAGILSRKEQTSEPDLRFFAYGVRPYIHDTYYEDLKQLFHYGFMTVDMPAKDSPTIFDTDGMVYRINNYKEFDKQGYTDKYPRGAFALKEKEQFETKETKILEVVWDVGKGGKVTPVAIFEPIELEGATIQRATLHNAEFMEELNLSEGDTLLVTRSGGIIPKILGKI